MAINKVVNKQAKSHGAMRNVIEYVLQDKKVREGYVEITGPFPYERINWDNVYKAFLNEKKIWNKDSGRMYAQNIISFHKNEMITPSQCLDIGKDFCNEFFPNHQCLISVHQDKGHLHCHIITNSVSFVDGRKLHQTKKDLEKQKFFTNGLCLNRGLTIAEKGMHFDGTAIDEGEVISWNKDKYNLLLNDSKKSFLAECAMAIIETLKRCFNREMFLSGMKGRGWQVNWEDKRKHITFINDKGNKVRDSNISKTFAMNISKEGLTNEFERQNEQRIKSERENAELASYYSEVRSAISEIDNARTITNDTELKIRDECAVTRIESSESQWTLRGYTDDTESVLAESRANRRSQKARQAESGAKRDDSLSKRADRDYEQERLRLYEEQSIRSEALQARKPIKERTSSHRGR